MVRDGGGYSLRVSPFGFQVLAGLKQDVVIRSDSSALTSPVSSRARILQSKTPRDYFHAPVIEHVHVHDIAERCDSLRRIVDHRPLSGETPRGPRVRSIRV
jgi:hypothetical protein